MTKMRALLLLLVALLVAGVAGSATWAQTTNTSLMMAGRPVILSVDGVVAVCTNADTTGNGFKRCAVIGTEVAGGVPVHLLVRIQRASNGLFVDIVTGSSLSDLSTRASSLSLTGRSHPTPALDAIDTAALLDAAD